jgi:hypothetical protein
VSAAVLVRRWVVFPDVRLQCAGRDRLDVRAVGSADVLVLEHLDRRCGDDVGERARDVQRVRRGAAACDNALDHVRVPGGQEEGGSGADVGRDQVRCAEPELLDELGEELRHGAESVQVRAALGMPEAGQVDRDQPAS